MLMQSETYRGYSVWGHAIPQQEDVMLPERYAASGTITQRKGGRSLGRAWPLRYSARRGIGWPGLGSGLGGQSRVVAQQFPYGSYCGKSKGTLRLLNVSAGGVRARERRAASSRHADFAKCVNSDANY
jgi:hypothetical protein